MTAPPFSLPQPGYLDLVDISSPLQPEQLFGRSAPVELEIGMGRGDFLLKYAAACPEHDFLGVERKLVFLRRAVNKIGRAGLPNVRLLNVEARNLLTNYIIPGSLRAVHIYFPDPWPKVRHAGRRIVNSQLLDQIGRVLEPNGFLHLRTDHASYYADMLKVLATQPTLRQIEIPELLLSARTGFEDRFVGQGLPIYRSSYQKIEIADSVEKG